MILSPKNPPYFWLRSLLFLCFLVGGLLFVLWAEGFRLLEGKIVETSVLSFSTNPSGAAVFLDSSFLDTTPALSLGVISGEKTACFFQNNTDDFCLNFFLKKGVAELFHEIVILPSFLPIVLLGSEKDIVLDPMGHGLWKVFPDLDAAAFFNGQNFETFSSFPLLEELLRKPKIFSPDPHFSLRLGPKQNGFLFFSGKDLWYRDVRIGETTIIQTFPDDIADAFFLPDSDSFLVFLSKDILFFSHRFGGGRLLAHFDEHSAFFFAEEKKLFFLQNGFWKSISFDFSS